MFDSLYEYKELKQLLNEYARLAIVHTKKKAFMLSDFRQINIVKEVLTDKLYEWRSARWE